MLKMTSVLTAAALFCTGAACYDLPAVEAETVRTAVVAQSVVDDEARQVLELVNRERAAQGLPAYVLDEALSAAAAVRAEEIDEKFSHTRPDGRSSFSVLKDLGVQYVACGENIAKGSPTAQRVMTGWMGSSGHRRNILHARFTRIGIAVHEDAMGVKHWVQIFAA